jgi:hypothetical protein
MNVDLSDSPALQQYRAKVVGLAELRRTLEEHIGEQSLPQAYESLEKLRVCTKELESFRATLNLTELFIVKYNVVVINEHTVSYVLPSDCSRIEILQEAQALVRERDARDLVFPEHLERWSRHIEFTSRVGSSERICIDGHVEGCDAKDRNTQRKEIHAKGLSIPAFEDLAVAFAMHWVASGGPLFGWYKESPDTIREYTYWSRAERDTLSFSLRGLARYGIDLGSDCRIAAVSAKVSLERTLR